MKVLLSNDDGYEAKGLQALFDAISGVVEVVVIAPMNNKSAVSSALTLRQPLRIHRGDNGFYYVDGTPADCVHLALNGALDFRPDMVISGINHGANLGDDVIYSGTVAAAIEGRFLGLPAMAVSLAGSDQAHFTTAGRVVFELVERLIQNPLPEDTILNVNIPDVSHDKIKGIQSVRLGSRHQSQPIIRLEPSGDDKIYQIGPPGDEADAGPGTDFYAISENRVSITPLQLDMTRHHDLGKIDGWLSA